MLCWMAVTNTTELYVWVVFYGTFAGGIQGLLPAGLSSLTTDMTKAGVRLGMVFRSLASRRLQDRRLQAQS